MEKKEHQKILKEGATIFHCQHKEHTHNKALVTAAC